MIKNLLILIGIAIAIFLGIRYFTPKEIDFSNQYPYKKEVELGDWVFENVIKKQTLIDNDTITENLDKILAHLSPNIESKKYKYKLTVVDADMINAFALPGGRIVVYRGLIEKLSSAEELASVIAHEIGHIEKRHVVKKLLTALSLNILLSGDASVMGEIGNEVTNLSFSRGFEEEADNFAIDLLERSGTDPINLAKLFKVFLNEQEFSPPEFLSSHPDTEERRKDVLEHKKSKKFKEKLIPVNFNEFKRRIQENANIAE